MLKKLPALLLLVCLVLNLSACSGKEAVTESTQAKTESTEATATDTYTFTDAHGREITMDKNPAKVVVLSGSFAEMWELAGGRLTGVTADAPEDRNLNMEGVTIVGETTHKPNLETIVSLEPDFVILAADTEQHKALSESLDDMGINNAFFKVEFFDDYIAAMEIMTGLTGDEEAFTKNAENVREQALEVIEKAKDHENNKDDDRDNDAYVTNLTFALVVEPSTENGDDLVVKVIGADGTPIAAGRIAGTLTEQDIVDGVKELSPDENGNYSFTGITMIEGEQNFNLTLEGIQNLKEGVYLYSSEVRSEDGDEVSSQTLVGKAGGKHAVSVEMNITFELDVKETVVARERVWRTETTHEDPPPPAEYRLGFGVGQLEVIEEEVPLAAPPQTGDMSILWFAMIALSGCGLCILNLLEKRKCRA